MEEIIELLGKYHKSSTPTALGMAVKNNFDLGAYTREQTSKYNDICIRGVI